jgi:hypothetical protein
MFAEANNEEDGNKESIVILLLKYRIIYLNAL